MKNFGIGQIIIGIFAFVIVIGLMMFSGLIEIGGSSQNAKGTVRIWGTLPYPVMQKYTERLNTADVKVIYEEQDPVLYETDLINAFASGVGPDLFIMPHEDILRHSDKLLEIPYSNYPKRDYTTRYVDGANIFLGTKGVKALPLVVDPLIMYYNKHLISSAFLLDVPEVWDEFSQFALELNDITSNGVIEQSAVALGTYNNNPHAKKILSALLLQNNNPVVSLNSFGNQYMSLLSESEGLSDASAQVASFYTSFADKNNQNYSWNESLNSSLDAFIAGDLAIYFGPASELDSIRRKNPNLDFDVSLLPQVRDTKRKMTYGSFLGIAVSKHSRFSTAAINTAAQLAGNPISGELAADLKMAPPRRDLLGNKPELAYENLIFNSAIISGAWIDPDPENTSSVFSFIVENINSKALSVSDAIGRAHSDLNIILNRTINKTLPVFGEDEVQN